MRFEGHDVAEGLHVKDEGALTARLYRFEAGLEEFGDQAAELAEVTATVAEERPDQLSQGGIGRRYGHKSVVRKDVRVRVQLRAPI